MIHRFVRARADAAGIGCGRAGRPGARRSGEALFHGSTYDYYCFLPLYVFCGDRLLVSYLRPSKIDGEKHSWAVLALLIKRLRRAWPEVDILVRRDSGFCRWLMLRWFDRPGVDYVIGVAQNARLLERSSQTRALAERRYLETGEKRRLFGEIRYRARLGRRASRDRQGRARRPERQPALRGDQSPGRRATDLRARLLRPSDMENRIKEQLDLFADRTSRHMWWTNQFRLLFSSAYPDPDLFLLAAARLKPD